MPLNRVAAALRVAIVPIAIRDPDDFTRRSLHACFRRADAIHDHSEPAQHISPYHDRGSFAGAKRLRRRWMLNRGDAEVP